MIMEQKRILVDGEPMVIEPEATIELNEANPLTSNEPMRTVLASRDYDIIADLAEQESKPLVSVSLSHLRELTPLSEKAGRVGYFQTAKEEKKEPAFTIGKYEDIKKVWAQTW